MRWCEGKATEEGRLDLPLATSSSSDVSRLIAGILMGRVLQLGPRQSFKMPTHKECSDT
jgi:hypothetical protein